MNVLTAGRVPLLESASKVDPNGPAARRRSSRSPGIAYPEGSEEASDHRILLPDQFQRDRALRGPRPVAKPEHRRTLLEMGAQSQDGALLSHSQMPRRTVRSSRRQIVATRDAGSRNRDGTRTSIRNSPQEDS